MDFKEHLLAHFPEKEVDDLLLALEKEESVHALLLNPEKMEENTLLSLYPHLRKHPFIPHAFLYDKKEYDLGKSLPFDLGAFYIMDPSSMAVAHYLDPKPGMRVCDIAAAPGGKSIHCSILMENLGAILSNDISYPRAKELSGNVERMGRRNIVVTSGDLRLSKKHYQDYFDTVILDAPCSGSAMFRKNGEAKADWSIEKVKRLSALQKELIETAYSILSPGGRLLYSTCSFSYEEDEEVVLGLLRSHPEAKLIPIRHPSFYSHPDLEGAAHLFPSRYEGEGQFLCLLEKPGIKEAKKERKEEPKPKAKALLGPYYDPSCDFLEKDGEFYSLPLQIPVKGLSLLRYGLHLGSDKEPFMPSFAYARAQKEGIELTKEQAIAYLRGEEITLDKEKGAYPVFYHGLALGMVKVSGGRGKNHYPKGLRRDYSDASL